MSSCRSHARCRSAALVLLIAALLFAVLMPAGASAGRVDTRAGSPPSPRAALPGPVTRQYQYVAATGHWVSHGILAYWTQFGGVPVFGYPISEEIRVDGGSVQYFERARLEWHPGAWPERYDVLLGLLGVELAARDGLRDTPPFQPISAGNDAHCTFYAPTGHRLCFGFRDYWNAHGGLAIFGYPISEEFTEHGVTVQYFERQRFEYHPENPPEWQVEGGLLGRELLP
jgi:hypothetical protein